MMRPDLPGREAVVSGTRRVLGGLDRQPAPEVCLIVCLVASMTGKALSSDERVPSPPPISMSPSAVFSAFVGVSVPIPKPSSRLVSTPLNRLMLFSAKDSSHNFMV